jgi:hypothetical protein
MRIPEMLLLEFSIPFWQRCQVSLFHTTDSYQWIHISLPVTIKLKKYIIFHMVPVQEDD